MKHYSHPDNFPFWIQHNRHSSDDTPRQHVHDFVELIFVADGQATHRIQDTTYELSAGDVFIVNPGEPHEYELREGQQIEIMNCLFQPDLIPSSLLRDINASDSLDFYYVQPFLYGHARFHAKLNLQGEAVHEAIDLLSGLEREMRNRDYGFRPLIQLKLVELFLLLSRHYEKRNGNQNVARSSGELLVRRVCGYMERHYSEKMSLGLLSRLFHIGERQLNRQFNAHIGTSVIDHLHAIRIERAKKLLAETDAIVVAVANKVGYEDAASFSKLFAREVGCPPGKYRESIRSDVQSSSTSLKKAGE
ncbi:MAG: AraC family transcriptional regulator [Paenibacillus sp.]|nr:AraC family transcriptional regulator [Paenibacillus sp.]